MADSAAGGAEMMLEGTATSVLVGVPIDNLTMTQCLDSIGELIDHSRTNDSLHQVATVNVDFLVNAIESSTMRSLLQSTSLNLADGLPLVWGSRLAGQPLQERVAGADLVPLLAAESERRGWHVHFFGSAPEVMERSLKLLRERHPGARLTGESGPVISDPTQVDDAVLDGIAAQNADVLCVALGNPKQELFIASNIDRLGCGVAIGIGGSLDMLVGDRRRAPEWAQKVGLEWLVRALQEPKRLGPRYARDATVFAPKLLSYVRELRRSGNAELAVNRSPDGVTISAVPGEMAEPCSFDGGLGPATETTNHLRLQLGESRLSSAALGQLAGLLRRARSQGFEVHAVPAQGPLRSQLDRLELLDWYNALAAESAA